MLFSLKYYALFSDEPLTRLLHDCFKNRDRGASSDMIDIRQGSRLMQATRTTAEMPRLGNFRPCWEAVKKHICLVQWNAPCLRFKRGGSGKENSDRPELIKPKFSISAGIIATIGLCL